MRLKLMPEHSVRSCLWLVENGAALDPWDPQGKLPPKLISDLATFNRRWEQFADLGWDRSRREAIVNEAHDLAARVSASCSDIESVEVVVP